MQDKTLTLDLGWSGFTRHVANVPDPRRARGRLHEFCTVIALACAAMLAGKNTIASIERWAADAPTAVLEAVGCRQIECLYGCFWQPPSYDTFRRLLGEAAPDRTCTIGAEKAANALLAADGEDDFVARLLAGLGEYPTYFDRLGEVNRRGPAIIGEPPALAPLALGDFRAWAEAGATVMDVRPAAAFAEAHVPGAISIPLRAAFATWLGWVIPEGTPVVIVRDGTRARPRPSAPAGEPSIPALRRCWLSPTCTRATPTSSSRPGSGSQGPQPPDVSTK